VVLDEKIKGEIIDLLKKSRMGASNTEISSATGLSRPTIIKYLGIMKVQGMVDYRNVGMAKLWYLPLEIELSDLLEEKEIMSVLKRDEETGNITLFGRPRIIIPARFIHQMTLRLHKKQQEQIFRNITLERINTYEKATDTVLDKCSPKEIEDFIRTWVTYRLKNGWGRLKTLKLDHEHKKLTVTLDHSEVADAIKTYSKKPPKESVCHILSGVFLGFMEGAFKDTKFTCKEAQCTAKGDPTCQFTVKPA